jgi:hypothetical protein
VSKMSHEEQEIATEPGTCLTWHRTDDDLCVTGWFLSTRSTGELRHRHGLTHVNSPDPLIVSSSIGPPTPPLSFRSSFPISDDPPSLSTSRPASPETGLQLPTLRLQLPAFHLQHRLSDLTDRSDSVFDTPAVHDLDLAFDTSSPFPAEAVLQQPNDPSSSMSAFQQLSIRLRPQGYGKLPQRRATDGFGMR